MTCVLLSNTAPSTGRSLSAFHRWMYVCISRCGMKLINYRSKTAGPSYAPTLRQKRKQSLVRDQTTLGQPRCSGCPHQRVPQ